MRARYAADVPPTPQPYHRPDRPRVLVVDDETGLRHACERVLAQHADVVVVGDGQGAREACAAAPFDLALVDVRLPDTDGFALMAELQASCPRLDVVVMTASAVCVTVFQLFCRSSANLSNFNIKGQVNAGQWVLAVNSDVVAFYFGYCYNLQAVFSFGVELHAYFNVVDATKHVRGQLLHHAVIAHAVSFRSGDAHVKFVANHFAQQCFFQAWNNVACAVQIRQRLLAF